MTGFTRRGFASAVALASAGAASDSAAAAVTATTDWPMAARDAANSGVLPDVDGPHDDLGVAWSRSFDALVTRPVLLDSMLYVGTDAGVVVALDAGTGAVEWRYDARSELGLGVAATDDRVYVGTMPADAADGGPGAVHAIRRADGSRAWRRKTDRGVETPPTVADGAVIVGDEGGRTYALAADDGSVRWTHDGDQAMLAAPAIDADSGTVVVRGDDGDVTALDLASGEERWTAYRALYAPTCAPAVADGRVYVGGYDDEQGHVFARDVASGDPHWHRTLDGPVVAAPAVDGRRVYVHDGAHVHALDPESGDDEWRSPVGARGAVAVAGDTVYAATPKAGLQALAADTGEEFARFTRDATLGAFPVVTDGAVFLTAGDDRVLALTEGAGSPGLTEIGAVGGVAALGVAGFAAYRRFGDG